MSLEIASSLSQEQQLGPGEVLREKVSVFHDVTIEYDAHQSYFCIDVSTVHWLITDHHDKSSVVLK